MEAREKIEKLEEALRTTWERAMEHAASICAAKVFDTMNAFDNGCQSCADAIRAFPDDPFRDIKAAAQKLADQGHVAQSPQSETRETLTEYVPSDTERLNWLDQHCAFVADSEFRIGPYKVGELRKMADDGIAQSAILNSTSRKDLPTIKELEDMLSSDKNEEAERMWRALKDRCECAFGPSVRENFIAVVSAGLYAVDAARHLLRVEVENTQEDLGNAQRELQTWKELAKNAEAELRSIRSATRETIAVPRATLMKWRDDAGPVWVDGDNERIVTLRVEIDNLLSDADAADSRSDRG